MTDSGFDHRHAQELRTGRPHDSWDARYETCLKDPARLFGAWVKFRPLLVRALVERHEIAWALTTLENDPAVVRLCLVAGQLNAALTDAKQMRLAASHAAWFGDTVDPQRVADAEERLNDAREAWQRAVTRFESESEAV